MAKSQEHNRRNNAGRCRNNRNGHRAQNTRRVDIKPQELDAETGLPQHLIDAIRSAYDEHDVGHIIAGWSSRRRVTLRANTLRANRDEVAQALTQANISFENVTWYDDAFVLDEGIPERSLWDLDIYKAGGIYLQSLSSMLPPLLLEPKAGADILDMCAAPGGKTSQMAALGQATNNTKAAHITSCELNAPRAEKLEYNLAKLGATNVQVMRTDARKLDSWFSFDQILLDAPCSGTGTVHINDEHAARNLTPELITRVERSQAALIEKALEILKSGGTLLYSTCSILPCENEAIVNAALAKHPECELMPIEVRDDIPTLPCSLDGAITVCPSEFYEGFFVAKIKKN